MEREITPYIQKQWMWAGYIEGTQYVLIIFQKNMSLLALQIKMLSFKIIFEWKVSYVPLFFLYKSCVCSSREKAIIWLPIKFPWSWDNTEAITRQCSGYWEAECLHWVLWKKADCIVYFHVIALVQNNYILLNTRVSTSQASISETLSSL